jgi:hypothetical protein
MRSCVIWDETACQRTVPWLSLVERIGVVNGEGLKAAGVSVGSDDESLWDSRIASEAEPHDIESSGATSV